MPPVVSPAGTQRPPRMMVGSHGRFWFMMLPFRSRRTHPLPDWSGHADQRGVGGHATAAERDMAASRAARYRSRMDTLALTIMASALTFSSFVVLLGWR